MEERKSYEKCKIASLLERGEERLFRSWRKKRRDDADIPWKSNQKEKIDDHPLLLERESKRRREVSEIVINMDVLEEIMVRVPVKSLIRFQIISKEWKRMVRSRSFKERYMLYQKTQEPKFFCLSKDKSWLEPNIAVKTMQLDRSSTYLVEDGEEYHTSHEEHQENVVVVSKTLDGLVCFYNCTDMTRPIKVMNPATRWSQTLPLARIQLEHLYKAEAEAEFPCLGFGKDYVTGTYKLVWLHNYASSCEVFDFGVKQWKQVIPPLPDHQIKHDQSPTYANGWLYWFNQEYTKLVAFDLHREMFQSVPNPIIKASSSLSVDMGMGSIDDNRGVVWISETNGDGMQHFWRLTNHNTEGALLKMDKMFSLDLNKITSTWFDTDFLSLIQLETISKNGNEMMLSKRPSRNLLLFQPLDPNSTRRIFSYSSPRPIDSVFLPYFPSLASPL